MSLQEAFKKIAFASKEIDAFIIRQATVTDLDQMVALQTLAYGHCFWYREDFYHDMTQARNTLYLLACRGEQILGMISCRRRLRSIHLSHLFVDPAIEGQGVAFALLQAIEAICDELSLPQITLEVRVSNQRALAFYRRQGFDIARTKYFYYANDHEHAYLMMKKWSEGDGG